MAHTATLTHSGFNLSNRFWAFVETVKTARAQAAEFHRTYSELQHLSDRELNDIGVRRCDIADIAHKHAYCA